MPSVAQSAGSPSAVGFSDLADINASNVGQLQLAFDVPTHRVGAEGSPPAEAGGMLFVLAPFPHTLYAIDVTAPPDSRVKWQYTPAADRVADGLSCCDRSAHGPVVDAGRILFTTLDGHVIAVDAATGNVRFDVAVTDLGAGETLASPPLVAEGRIFIGNAGDDFGVRGWIAALDAGTGRSIWKRYSTGPDGDVGVGPGFSALDSVDRKNDRGVSSWPPGAWKQGGGTVAGPLLYDFHAHAVLHGTGHPAPWNPDQRPGDNRWTAGLFARDAASGAARWFTGINAHDPYAFRSGSADLLLDRDGPAGAQHLLVHPDDNGLLYAIDRSSGAVLSADRLTTSVVDGVDPHTARPRYDATKGMKVARQTRDVCPAWTGGFGAGSSALAGAADLIVLPVSRLCMDLEPRPANYLKGTPYTGANVRLLLDHTSSGSVVAWNVAERKAAWRHDEKLPLLGGTLATGGGLIFYGTLDGAIKALDAHTGRLLWQYASIQGILSRPMTFRGRDGKQYLAVVAGAGRIRGLSRNEALDPRDPGAGFGLSGLVASLPQEKNPGGTLLVFRLP